MSRSRIPKLMHHKASGKAVVCLGGVDHYLGSWGTKIARAEYDRLVAEWLAGGRQTPKPSINLTVVEVMARYLDYADGYYVGPDGRPTTEPTAIRYALKPVRRLYGHTDAALFGPLCLKAGAAGDDQNGVVPQAHQPEDQHRAPDVQVGD